jgi:hypothetical protein
MLAERRKNRAAGQKHLLNILSSYQHALHIHLRRSRLLCYRRSDNFTFCIHRLIPSQLWHKPHNFVMQPVQSATNATLYFSSPPFPTNPYSQLHRIRISVLRSVSLSQKPIRTSSSCKSLLPRRSVIPVLSLANP